MRLFLTVVAVLFAAMLFAHGPAQTQARHGAVQPGRSSRSRSWCRSPPAARPDVIARLVVQHMRGEARPALQWC